MGYVTGEVMGYVTGGVMGYVTGGVMGCVTGGVIVHVTGSDLPIGPVHIDYGIPKPSNLHRDNDRNWPRNLDAPGRGSQEQKQRLLTNDRNA